MPIRSFAISAIIVLAFYATAFAAPPVHDNQIIVKMKPGKHASALAAPGKSVSFVRTMRLSYADYDIVRAQEGADPFSVARELEASGQVEFAYPNVVKSVSTLQELLDGPAFWPNDLYLLNPFTVVSEAWNNPRQCQWGLLYTNTPLAWHYTTGSSNVIVAVIDTGLKFEHPELYGRLWVNTGEIAGNAIDDDTNGFVDDINGYDFASYNSTSHTGGDSDPTDPQPYSEAHGTWVAGIIGAASNNATGISGVAGGGKGGQGGVRLMILRVGTNGSITVDAEVAALDYAVQNGAKVINMSFGGVTGGPPEANAITRAWNGGAIILAAAGNYPAGNPGGIDLPAGFPEVIAVGATTIFASRSVFPTTAIVPETLADYSKKGPQMGVTAPGTHIITLFGTEGYTIDPDTQFLGTSAATPIVSGFAALLASYFTADNNASLRSRIEASTIDLGPAGFDESYGHGRIDMAKAFRSAPPPPPPALEGDANADGVVNNADVNELSSRYGKRTGDSGFTAAADTNTDGVIDELDIFAIGLNFGKSAT